MAAIALTTDGSIIPVWEAPRQHTQKPALNGKHQVSGGQTRSGAFSAPIYEVSAPNAPRVVITPNRRWLFYQLEKRLTEYAPLRKTDNFWLTIPTAAAGKSRRGGRINPVKWERSTGLRLRFVYRRSGPSLLVAEGRLNKGGRAVASRSKTGRGLTTVPIFLLVPQVKLQKRLDLDRDTDRAHDSLPGLIVANWFQV